MGRRVPLLVVCLALGLGSGCSSTTRTGQSPAGASCNDSTGAIATAAKACALASDCQQAIEPTCCGPVMEVGLAKPSSCTFTDLSCPTNASCPAYIGMPEQAEDGKNTVRGGSVGLACVSGQCMTFVIAGSLDAGTDEGCTGSACSTDAGGDVLSCVDWYRYPAPGGDNVLINNVWNEQHAGSYPYRQCLTAREVDGSKQYGWAWNWPSCDRSTSFAAPEIMFGRKPWDGGASTSPSLPKRIDAIAGLLVDFGVDVEASSCYNLNTTMWLTQSNAAPKDPDPQNLTTEVMVRFNDAGNIGGCCTRDGNVTLGGIAF